MAYNNLISRILISSLFFITYFLICFLKFEYIFYLILIIYFVIFIEIFNNFKNYKLLITSYLLISIFFLFEIDFKNDNYTKFNLMVICVISFDIFSYFLGTFLGKNKILYKISPNKTLEGLVGGIILSLLITIFYSYIVNINYDLNLFIFILIIIFSSFIGDIIESIFKRLNNLKNSSNYLPGHGGFFDRFDSFVFSIITYSLFISLI